VPGLTLAPAESPVRGERTPGYLSFKIHYFDFPDASRTQTGSFRSKDNETGTWL